MRWPATRSSGSSGPGRAARQAAAGARLAGDEATPLALAGGLLLWLLRLMIAPASTLAGFRAWVIEECPLAPGRRAARPAQASLRAAGAGRTAGHRARGPRTGTKTAAFLRLVGERHGPLAGVPVGEVSRICSALAPQVDLNTGAAPAPQLRPEG